MVPDNCFHKHFLIKLSHWRQKNKSMRHSTGWSRLKTRSPPSTRPIPSFLQSQALDNESHAKWLCDHHRKDWLPGKLGTGILLTCPISTATSVLQWRDSMPPSYGKTQERGDVLLASHLSSGAPKFHVATYCSFFCDTADWIRAWILEPEHRGSNPTPISP